MGAIEIRGVHKRFGSTHAVRDLDLEVPEGSLCGFLGPNGAGKSTTIRMIMSIIRPDEGELKVLGSDALHNKDRIGYLPEERGVYRKMRVGEFVRYIAKLKGVDRPGFDQVVREWLDRVALPDVERKRCEELSKGMQQKVQFLAAVIHDPDLVILDEPFSGLDPVNAELLQRLIRELHEAGKSIIFSTHVLHQAEMLCDRIFLINHGVKLLDAPLDEIRRRFDPRTVAVEPLDGAEPGPLRDALADLDGVIEAWVDEQGRGVELRFDRDEDAIPLMRAVLERAEVRGVRRKQLTLQEVFVRQVREDLGEDAARTAREELSHVH